MRQHKFLKGGVDLVEAVQKSMLVRGVCMDEGSGGRSGASGGSLLERSKNHVVNRLLAIP